MTAVATAASSAPTAGTTPSATSAAGTSASASTIAATVWPAIANRLRLVAVEVWLIGKVPSALDGQRRCGCSNGCTFALRFRNANHATSRAAISAAHLRALFFQDRLARKPDAIAFNG